MHQIFALWDECLMRLTFHQNRFLSTFLDESCFALVLPTQIDPKVDDYRESVVMWLLHILIHPKWNTSREVGCVIIDSVVQICISNPTCWTLRLVTALLDHPKHRELRQRYSELIEKIGEIHVLKHPACDCMSLPRLAQAPSAQQQ